jgi:RNA-directed DNA polymerase
MFHGKMGTILHKQKGKCIWCKLTFRDEDVIEIDHIDRNKDNNKLDNLRALHLHCHDERHAKLKALDERLSSSKGPESEAVAGVNNN